MHLGSGAGRLGESHPLPLVGYFSSLQGGNLLPASQGRHSGWGAGRMRESHRLGQGRAWAEQVSEVSAASLIALWEEKRGQTGRFKSGYSRRWGLWQETESLGRQLSDTFTPYSTLSSLSV